jgi:hypothetical protein
MNEAAFVLNIRTNISRGLFFIPIIHLTVPVFTCVSIRSAPATTEVKQSFKIFNNLLHLVRTSYTHAHHFKTPESQACVIKKQEYC